ncbi:MAG: threonine--tRNA ligase, partial [Thermoprotei archaeon]
GILIEHYGGDFPVWLAPVQAIVIPVNDRFATYAREVYNILFDNDVRVAIDDRPQTLNKRIRDAELHKIPYILVVGAREQANGTVSVRRRKVGNLGELSIEEFIQKIKEESRI